jgi:hypothetical protein
MTSLTQEQFSELQDIANGGDSGARVAYYTKLAEFGVTYGSLALGVVLEDQISGRVANAYFMAVAEREGVSVSPQQWAAIGDALMHADLAARLESEVVAPDGSVSYPDLGYKPIRDYHEQVFSTLGGTVPEGEGVSINAWTAYAPVELLGPEAWDTMVADSAVDLIAGGVPILYSTVRHMLTGVDPLAIEWLSIIHSNAFEATLAGGSPAQFVDQIHNTHIILGTHSPDSLTIADAISPSAQVLVMGLGGADVIQTQGAGDFYDGGSGNDTFIALLGGDSIHGSSGNDTVDYSGLSNGITAIFSASIGVTSAGKVDQLFDIESLIGTTESDTFNFYGSPAIHPVEHIDAGEGVDNIAFTSSNEAMLIDLQSETAIGQVTERASSLKISRTQKAGLAPTYSSEPMVPMTCSVESARTVCKVGVATIAFGETPGMILFLGKPDTTSFLAVMTRIGSMAATGTIN